MRPPSFAAEENSWRQRKERKKEAVASLRAVAVAAFDARSFHLETLGGVRLEMRANRGCNSASPRREPQGVSPHGSPPKIFSSINFLFIKCFRR